MLFPFFLGLMKIYSRWLKKVKDGLGSFQICCVIALAPLVN